VKRGDFPAPTRIAGRSFWTAGAVDEWQRSRRARRPLTTLRAARLARGWTLTKVSVLVDLSREYIARVERGEQTAGPVQRKRLSLLFGVTENELFGDEPREAQP
jgi:hypothetical protein